MARKTKGFKLPASIFPRLTRAEAKEDVAKLVRKFPQFKFRLRRKGSFSDVWDVWGYKK